MKILVVDDDQRLASNVAAALRHRTYAVDTAGDGPTATELIYANDYDAVVLDWGLPERSGLQLLESWREEGREVPVLMLTARSAVEAVVRALDTGADDYLTKPFKMEELLARLRSLLRRRPQRYVKLSTADLELDLSSRSVSVGGREVQLTPKELSLLEYLLRHKDEVVSRSEIEAHVWDSAIDSFSNFVDVTVYRLRKKIDAGGNGRLLHGVRGAGFVLRSQRS